MRFWNFLEYLSWLEVEDKLPDDHPPSGVHPCRWRAMLKSHRLNQWRTCEFRLSRIA